MAQFPDPDLTPASFWASTVTHTCVTSDTSEWHMCHKHVSSKVISRCFDTEFWHVAHLCDTCVTSTCHQRWFLHWLDTEFWHLAVTWMTCLVYFCRNANLIDVKKQSLMSVYIEYIDGMRLLLEGEAVRDTTVVQDIRLHFSNFITLLIKHCPGKTSLQYTCYYELMKCS